MNVTRVRDLYQPGVTFHFKIILDTSWVGARTECRRGQQRVDVSTLRQAESREVILIRLALVQP